MILQRANMLNLICEFTNAIGKSWIVKFELFISWHISHPSFGLLLKYCCIEARKHLIINAARYWITHEMTMHIDMFNSWFKTSQLSGRAVQVVESLQRWEWRGWQHGPLARYVKLRVAHAPLMPGTFSPPPRVSVPDMHHGTCVTHVPWHVRDARAVMHAGIANYLFPWKSVAGKTAFPVHAQPAILLIWQEAYY